ncbi:hypothetical protein BOX15_Mlig019099g5, partial [Macrostomum lignano]
FMRSQQSNNTSLYTLLQSRRAPAHSIGSQTAITPGKSQDRITRHAQANHYLPTDAPVSFLDSRSSPARPKPSSKPNSLKAANNLAVSAASLDQPSVAAASGPAAESSLGSLELLSSRLQTMMAERRDELNKEAAYLLKCQVAAPGSADVNSEDAPAPPPRRQSAAAHNQKRQEQKSDSSRLSRSRSADDTLNLSDDIDVELNESVSNDCVLDEGARPSGSLAPIRSAKQPSSVGESSGGKRGTFGFLSRFRSGQQQQHRQDGSSGAAAATATASPKKSHSSRFPSFRKLLRMPKKIKRSPLDENKFQSTDSKNEAATVVPDGNGAADAAHSNGLPDTATAAKAPSDSPDDSSSAYLTASMTSPAADSGATVPTANGVADGPFAGTESNSSSAKPALLSPIVTVTMATADGKALHSENLPNKLLTTSIDSNGNADEPNVVNDAAKEPGKAEDLPTVQVSTEAPIPPPPEPATSEIVEVPAPEAADVPVTLRGNRSGGSPSGVKVTAMPAAGAAQQQQLLLPLPVGTSTPTRGSPGRGRLGYNRRKTKSCTECDVPVSSGGVDSSAAEASDLVAAVVSASASADAAGVSAAALLADAKARERSSLIMISAAMRGAAILAAGMTRSLNFDALHAAELDGEDADADAAEQQSDGDGEKCAGRYFLMLADREEKKIRTETDWIEAALADRPDLSEEVAGIFRVAVGKAKLFLAEKLAQFRGLCEDNLSGGVTQYCDLNGFWAICGLQIDDLNNKLLQQCRTIRDAGFVVIATSSKASAASGSPEQQASTAPTTKAAARRPTAAKKATTSSATAKSGAAAAAKAIGSAGSGWRR